MKYVKPLGILTVTAILLSLFLGMSLADDGKVTTTDVDPYTPTNQHLQIDKVTYDNSGSDTMNITCEVGDNGTEDEFNSAYDNGDNHRLILFLDQSGGTDSAYDNGTDTDFYIWSFVWNDLTNGKDPVDASGNTDYDCEIGMSNYTAGDGIINFSDDQTTGGKWGVVITIPSSWSPNTAPKYYGLYLEIGDGDGTKVTRTVAFSVSQPITTQMRYANGNDATGQDWGSFSSDPTGGNSGIVPSDWNASGCVWVVVQNTGSNSGQQFTVSFSGTTFDSVGATPDTIPIDNNIRFVYYETATAPGGGDDPDEQGGETLTAVDADGDITLTFSAVNYYYWVFFVIEDMASDDVLKDDDYTQAYTITPL